MGWDFATDPDFEPTLAWIREFVDETIIPIDLLSDGLDQAALDRLAAFDLELVEQPLPADDLAGAARLRERAIVPIAADEAVRDCDDVVEVVRRGSADLVVLKPGFGGLSDARRSARASESPRAAAADAR